ncbi:MAG: hypothetical protein KBD51_00990 [Candidatus Levybacteria bacterium]|nr:hypothetical protein [Candidatus Levybacteria bacterium]
MPSIGLSKPTFSKKKLLLLGFLLVILLVIPVTVFLVQQQQNLQSQANPNTTLSFVPPDKTAAVGEKIDFDIWISPGNNQVNFVKLVIKFDATKLSTETEYFKLNPASNLSILEGPIIGDEGDSMSVILSVENDPTKVIRADVKIGTISFDTLDVADPPTEISFDDQQVQIRSINGANQDAFNENVFLNGTPATLTIQGDPDVTPDPNATLTPTITGALTPTITSAATPTLTPTPTSTTSGEGAAPSTNQAPVCESLITDRSPDGTAPLSITFTATGSDTDGTISKVTFSFGDGTVEDVTTGGGIGTDTVNVQKSFTYNNANSFTASALMTDDSGDVSSDSSSCAVTVTVSDGDGTVTTVDSGDATIAPTGPTQTLFGIGAIGGLLFIVGALLFFAL